MSCEADSWLRRVFSGLLVVIWIAAPYCLLQQVSIRDVWWVAASSFDRMIPLRFEALWLYFSYFLLLGWVGLTLERFLYLRFLITIGWVTLVSHMVFLFAPSGVSREMVDLEGAPLLYQWVVVIDMPRNAFPSLHASLSMVSAMGVMKSERFNVAIKLFVWVWVLGIYWSAIALRQHYIVDLVGGGLLGLMVWIVMGHKKLKVEFT